MIVQMLQENSTHTTKMKEKMWKREEKAQNNKLGQLGIS